MAPGTAAGHYASAQVLLVEKRMRTARLPNFARPSAWILTPGFRTMIMPTRMAAKGDWDGAIFEYRQALRLQPDSVVAHSNLGYALASKGDLAGGTAGRCKMPCTSIPTAPSRTL